MGNKERLSVTVDAEMIAAAHIAVEEGRAENVSAWVNDALRRQYEHERRLAAAKQFIEAYEAQFGEITQEEIEETMRDLRANAIVVRGKPKRQRRI